MRVLLALDEAATAASEALRLSRLESCCLTALFVKDTGWNEYTGHDWLSGSGSRADYLEYARDEEHSSEAAAVKKLKELAQDFPLEIKCASGRPDEVILAELALGYDVLVLPYPFKRGLGVVRDYAARLIKDSPCSLWLVKT